MTVLIFFLIALAWIAWLVAWGRDRRVQGLALAPVSGGTGRLRLEPPRTTRMARRRRREVLAVLTGLAIVTLLLARAWAGFWVVHLMTDVALIAYAAAVVALERPGLLAQLRSSFLPTPDSGADRPFAPRAR